MVSCDCEQVGCELAVVRLREICQVCFVLVWTVISTGCNRWNVHVGEMKSNCYFYELQMA